mmetsp:Transcript_63752/g.106018  ORF Transcript_63752/g.106018 Transcript_63752/m.106018 type:complete len:87 (+) Transcript_63752:1067-1327(+)
MDDEPEPKQKHKQRACSATVAQEESAAALKPRTRIVGSSRSVSIHSMDTMNSLVLNLRGAARDVAAPWHRRDSTHIRAHHYTASAR